MREGRRQETGPEAGAWPALKAKQEAEFSFQLRWEAQEDFEQRSDILDFHLKRLLWLMSGEQAEGRIEGLVRRQGFEKKKKKNN